MVKNDFSNRDERFETFQEEELKFNNVKIRNSKKKSKRKQKIRKMRDHNK